MSVMNFVSFGLCQHVFANFITGLVSWIGCKAYLDDILWQLDGETWVACFDAVCELVHFVIVDDCASIHCDAIAFYVLKTETLVDCKDALQMEYAMEHWFLCLFVDGE